METWTKLRDRPAELLREDFCGTANTACEWVRHDARHCAIGIDWDSELLGEAGCTDITVYWEGTDEQSNEGDGVFSPTEVGDADPGWICYIVAEK